MGGGNSPLVTGKAKAILLRRPRTMMEVGLVL